MSDRVSRAVIAAVALYAAAAFLPTLLPVAVAAATAGLAALVLLRRPARALKLALVALAALTAGLLALASAFAAQPRTGFLVLVGVVFGLFLPVAPWLYARTFVSPSDNAP